MKYYYVTVGDQYVGAGGLGPKSLAYQYTWSYCVMVMKEYSDAGYTDVWCEEAS